MQYDNFLALLDYSRKRSGRFVTPENADKLSKRWILGGIEGCGPYDDSSGTPATPESEPAFEELNTFLEDIVPNITYLQYMRLLRDTATEDTDPESSYYGNYTNWKTVTILVKDLYTWLNDQNMI